MDGRSSDLTISERLCAVFVPLIGVIEALVLSFVGCFIDQPPRRNPEHTYNDLVRIATDSPFTVNEVEALLELFKKLSTDGLIHKEELKLAILKAPLSENLILDRVFYLFDEKKHGVIEFEGFVRVLGIFHPRAPIEEKIDFAFRLYDLRLTGYIERKEVQILLNAILLETGMQLPEETLDAIIDKTFADADADMDGRINKSEWKAFVIQHPTLLRNMTLPCLQHITTAFPSFIFNTEVDD